jgi:hypothetical protein
MSDSRALVAEAIAATRIRPPARYTWFGQISPPLPARTARALSPHAAREYLIHLLASQLYSDFYRRGRAEPASRNSRRPAASRRQFEAALSGANCGQGYADDGWRVRGLDERGVLVAKDGLELTVDATELAGPAAGTGPLAAGQPVVMRLPKELFEISPGFYLACGDRQMAFGRSRPVVRLYWNLRADGAVPGARPVRRRRDRAAQLCGCGLPAQGTERPWHPRPVRRGGHLPGRRRLPTAG